MERETMGRVLVTATIENLDYLVLANTHIWPTLSRARTLIVPAFFS